MNLALDESQQLLSDTFSEFFARECPASLVRETESIGFASDLWSQLAELGAPGMGLPESAGGVDAGMLELGIVSAACGRALAPVPFAEVVTASRVLANRTDDDTLFRAIGAGTERVSIALHEGTSDASERTLVPAGHVVDHVVALQGDELTLWSNSQGPAPERTADLGSGAHAFWNLSGASPAKRRVLEAGASARRRFELAVAEWKLLTAFSLVGLAQQALAVGAEYARTREQFGSPIGRFQAVAHPLADCATRIDGAELLVWEAAWARTEQPERFAELCSMAFVFASQTAQQTTAVSLHTHGGYGVSLEYDIQLFHRRACAWSLVGGGARNELLNLADIRFGSPDGVEEAP